MEKVNTSPKGKFAGAVFRVLAWLLVACIVAQTFIAGMALFQDSTHWKAHVLFVHFFEVVPLLMLVFAFAGRLPVRTRWLSLALFGLIFIQYMTANLPAAGAMHPVIALALIVLSLHVARRPAGV
ncbi:DUF6220 domain-containing protein [Cohnella hongkongensis]|uniref:DUF6220 domain-containing protein n=1 Tax=Cohnella hongkongensis TaxID=178337 RepID=A0ABV9FGQ6_9BACL